MADILLAQAIKFDEKKNTYILAEQYNPAAIDQMLRQIAYESAAGYDLQETHALLAQNILEPIRMTVPYAEMYGPLFLNNWPVGEMEDPTIPIEDIPTVAWETHRDGQVAFVRANFTWTRPEFTTFDIGIEVNWHDLRRAGWNYLQRQMTYATEALARKRDAKALLTLEAAIPAGHKHEISGGALTRASVKAVLKASQLIGFPMTMCLVNPATATDMAEWTFPTSQSYVLTPEDTLVRNLWLGNYGGCSFTTNVHASSTILYFSGPKNGTGYVITRGNMKTASDVDIRKKMDLHAIYDQDYGWYIANGYNLRKLTITA